MTIMEAFQPNLKSARIFIVDDEPANVLVLQRMLEDAGYTEIQSLSDSREVFERVASFAPDLILLDLHMPFISGLEILEQLPAVIAPWEYLPILVLTADANAETRHRALKCGARDFLVKPFDPMEVLLRVANLLETRLLYARLSEDNRALGERVSARARELEDAQLEIVERLAIAAEYRDDDTGKHTNRVGVLSARVAAVLGLPEEEVTLIRRAAPLHDVGKIGIPDEILLKPGRLTPEEMTVMKTHVEIGAGILSGSHFPLLRKAEEIARYHHERWDGTGYNQSLSGEAIPLAGRVVAVLDVYDALTSERPYKRAWSVEDAVAEIRAQSGRQFDPAVVNALLRVLAEDGLAQKGLAHA